MQGGYLRVMYPAPQLSLNLESWQEFCGFDREGSFAWFAFDFDTEQMTITLRQRFDAPLHAVCFSLSGRGRAPETALSGGLTPL